MCFPAHRRFGDRHGATTLARDSDRVMFADAPDDHSSDRVVEWSSDETWAAARRVTLRA
jgi:hypothetical protein